MVLVDYYDEGNLKKVITLIFKHHLGAGFTLGEGIYFEMGVLTG
jgi:hypothetical protein